MLLLNRTVLSTFFYFYFLKLDRMNGVTMETPHANDRNTCQGWQEKKEEPK